MKISVKDLFKAYQKAEERFNSSILIGNPNEAEEVAEKRKQETTELFSAIICMSAILSTCEAEIEIRTQDIDMIDIISSFLPQS